MAEIEVNGSSFNILSMNAKEQFNVFRKVAPVIKGLGQGLASLTGESALKSLDQMELSEILQIGGPLIDALAGMDDETTDYVLDKCMSKVQIKAGGGWVNVCPQPGRFLFEDKITMTVMLQLVIAVLQQNGVLSFFTEGPAPNSAIEGFPSQ